MSSALIRQALEFVDQEGLSHDKTTKRRAARRIGQDHRQLYKAKTKLRKQREVSTEQTTEENVKRLLALSKPVVDSSLTEKIVERAVKGRPLADFIEVSKEEEKSILFPDETFEEFERKLFCS